VCWIKINVGTAFKKIIVEETLKKAQIHILGGADQVLAWHVDSFSKILD
jgi:hypothetical protein